MTAGIDGTFAGGKRPVAKQRPSPEPADAVGSDRGEAASTSFGEAWSVAHDSLRRHAAQAVVVALALTCLLGFFVTAELTAVRRITGEARHFRNAGASIHVIEAPAGIDGVACDALSDLAGVRASGALRRTGYDITPAALPSSPIPVWEATAGLPNVLRASNAFRRGVILPERTFAALGLADGRGLITSTSRVEVAGDYPWPRDGRGGSLGWAALVQVADQRPFDECWVETWPASPDARSTLSAGVASGHESPTMTQLNTTLGASFDGLERFRHRSTRHAPILAPVLAFLVGLACARWRSAKSVPDAASKPPRGRSGSTASSRAASKRSKILPFAIEVAVWTVPAWIVSTLAIGLSSSGDADATALRILGFRIVALGTAGMVLGVLTALGLTVARHNRAAS